MVANNNSFAGTKVVIPEMLESTLEQKALHDKLVQHDSSRKFETQ